MHDFLTSCTGHLENISSLIYAGLPKANTLYCCCCLVTKSYSTFCDPTTNVSSFCPWDFSRQEYWSGLPYPSLGSFQLRDQNPCLLHCQVGYHWATWEAQHTILHNLKITFINITLHLLRKAFVGGGNVNLYSTREQSKVPLKLKIELIYDSAIPLLGTYLDKIIIWKDTCTCMFIAALFTMHKVDVRYIDI